MGSAVTLRVLADRLAIAPSTVSRALAGEPGVGPDMIRQVQNLAKTLNYRRAGSKKRKFSRSLGLLIATEGPVGPEDSFQQETIRDVACAVAESDWHVHIAFVEREMVGGAKLPAMLRDNCVDGVLLSGHPTREFCDLVRNAGCPAIVLQDTVERTGFTAVMPNVGPATEAVTHRLAEIGHRRIGFVATPLVFPTVRSRYDGYRRAIESLEPLGVSGVEVHVTGSSLHQGQAAVRQLLSQPQHPTAIIFATDHLAIGGLCELARAGLDVPRQVSIVGHDNTSLSRECDPALSSVELSSVAAVKMAVETLQRMIVGTQYEEPRQLEVPCRMIWRASSGPLFQA